MGAARGPGGAMIDDVQLRRLVAMLVEGAELEHALLCQYLYAAFSLKRRPEEGVSWHQLELMRRWEASIMLIARQEMEHLGLVCNLLAAIGEAPGLARPGLPLKPRYYKLDVASRLAPFSEHTLERFAAFERPDEHDRHTIAHLYGQIGALITALGDELFVGPPGAQLSTTDVIPTPLAVRGVTLPATARIYDMQLEPVTNAASALAVVQQIIDEGEGGPGGSPTSHYARVLSVLAEFRAERRRDPEFQPARPVSSSLPADPRTRAVSELFDRAYETLLLLLARFFAHSDERAPELTALQRAAFMPMMTTVMRPLGELLTELPTGHGTSAAPAFRVGRTITLLPHRPAAWKVIQGELDALAASARELAADAALPRLAMMSENLGRIALDFGLAMGTEVTPQPGAPLASPPTAGVVSLVLAFEGWCSLRQPTDPDPFDEPRGVSGYSFAFAGEPDLDRVINLQPRPGGVYRSHGPELGVSVRAASRTDGQAVPALLGA